MQWIEKQMVQSQFWVAFCFTALAAFLQWAEFQEVEWEILIFQFSGVWAAYLWITGQFEKNLFFKLLTAISGLVALLFMVLYLHPLEIIWASIAGGICLLYKNPLDVLDFRKIPVLKLPLIAAAWTIILVMIPAWSQHETVFLLLFSVGFYVIGLTIPFDIRDLTEDEEQMMTIPQKIGILPAKILATILLGLSAFFYPLESPWIWWITLGIATAGVWFSGNQRNRTYYSFWLEGISILPLMGSVLIEILMPLFQK